MNFNKIITKCILQIRGECQFFGALMLFAEISESSTIETAATDGKKIYVNSKFLLNLNSKEQNALLLHEVLHMALLHVTRRSSRDSKIWNIAADIVVNNLIIENTNYKLPKGAIIDSLYSEKSVEEVYEKILKKPDNYSLTMVDILDPDEGGELSIDESLEIESYWKDKMQVLTNAELGSGETGQGTLPGGLYKEIAIILEPEVDWRHALWKFVAKTPVDFDDLDRRFIYRGLYLEGLMAESLEVNVCIDTSGSISSLLLDKFLAELKGILDSYPHVKCSLFFADTNLYGPYTIENIKRLPAAEGFGGTSFVPFFQFLSKDNNSLLSNPNKVAIYFTDGYGDFPKESPLPTMWLVPSDCLESKEFPFGEVIRISSD